MSITEYLEIERKYDVDESMRVPSFLGVSGVGASEAPHEFELTAAYFDTAGFALASAGVTLRRRTGGDDAGWHLKIPVGEGRQELRLPLGRAVKSPPQALVQLVRVYTRRARLEPVVTVATRRVVHRLTDVGGTILAEFSDDHVTTTRPGPVVDAWREWELELVSGSTSLLDAAEPLILAAGASRSTGSSKLARALGDAVPARPRPYEPSARSAAAVVPLAYLSAQREEISRLDPAFRLDQPEALHDLRVAIRRTRSCLATYRSLFDEEAVEALRAELSWIGGVLGTARDAEVLRVHMRTDLAAQPDDLVIGPVATRLDDDLTVSYRHGRDAALAVLDEARYLHLLDTLDAFLAEPTISDRGRERARKVIPKRIRHDWRRLTRAVAAAEAAEDSATRDLELHEARKAAKRLRYAAESARPVAGKPAKRVAHTAKQLQTVLGDHHDSVVQRELLRRVAMESFLRGDNTFTYGRLHALAQVRAARLESEWWKLWRDTDAPRTRDWS